MARGSFHIGTSGWHYDEWTGPFYPKDLPPGERLDHYTRRLSCVEINNTYYQMPKPETLEAWRSVAPDGFLFAVKASGYISHRKKLKDPQDTLPVFYETIDRLGNRLGPVLYQLPPHWHADLNRLEAFLRILPRPASAAFEFRDRSWIVDEARELLSEHGAAFCIYHLSGYESPRWVTSPSIVYVRLHGPGNAYQGSYDGRTLNGWRHQIEGWVEDGRQVFVFFNNDQAGYAAQDALALREKLER